MSIFENFDRFGTYKTKIGFGTYGEVFNTTTNYAVKVCGNRSDGVLSTTLKELAIMRFINHPNLTNMQGIFFDGSLVHTAMNLAKGTLQVDSIREPAERINIIFQLLSAVEYLHRHSIIHRDIKLENILVFDDHIELCDFGMAKYHSTQGKTHSTDVCTLWYRAPELLLEQIRYDYGPDIWSVGVVYLALITGENLITGQNEIGQLHCIFELLGTPTREEFFETVNVELFEKFPKYSGTIDTILKGTPEQEAGLLRSLLTWPKRRATAQQALNHYIFVSCEIVPADAVFPTITKIDMQFRKKAFLWLWLVFTGFHLHYSTLFCTFKLFDLYMERSELNVKNLFKYCISMLNIATKLHESSDLNWDDCAELASCTRQDLVNCEREIITAMDCQLFFPIITDFYYRCPKTDEHATMACIAGILLNEKWVLNWSDEKIVRYAMDISGTLGCIYLSETIRNDIKEYFYQIPQGKLRNELIEIVGKNVVDG